MGIVELLLQILGTTILLGSIFAIRFIIYSESKLFYGKNGKKLDPIGGSNVKNFLGLMMARIAKFKEKKKGNVTAYENENWHIPENHPNFNESHYLNGIDASSGARVITRISHRGEKGDKSYIFLLIFHPKLGVLSMEKDNVPLGKNDSMISKSKTITAEAGGLRYECIEPMKKWKLTYDGDMRVGCNFPITGNERHIPVKVDLIYKADSRLFWYMRDDHPTTLGKNLSQETWNYKFIQYCLNRSSNHGHYEDYGHFKGTINKIKFDMETFRDHSWDIRTWAAIDRLVILLIGFVEPIEVNGKKYKYLNTTLVDMPENINGVGRWSGGYMLAENDVETPILKLVRGTSILDIEHRFKKGSKEREPTDEQVLELSFEDEKGGKVDLEIKMNNLKNRLMYWPDGGSFEVNEDSVDFEVTIVGTNQKVKAIGTRQIAFRIGDFDPSLGGVG